MDKLLQAAIKEAKRGLSEGGIPIGSVLAVDGKIIGRGHNRRVQDGSVVKHAEMDCLENAGRLKASVYRRAVLYSTLSPCDMCSGAVLLYGIPKVVVGENVNFKGPEEYVRGRGVEVKVVNDKSCIKLMADFIKNCPELWNEDIGEEVNDKRGVAAKGERIFKKRHPSQKQQRMIVHNMKEHHMTNVRMTKTSISGDYDGRRLEYPVREKKRVKTIGNWRHCPDDTTILIDSDVKPAERGGVLVHEAVEQYMQKEYGLSYPNAHHLATLAERHYVESHGGNWRSHEITVFKTKI